MADKVFTEQNVPETNSDTFASGDKKPRANRRRNVRFNITATEEEAARIRERMAEMGVTDMGAYARRMMIEGLHITVDLTDVREMVSLLRRIGLNVNQIAKRVNETHSVYSADLNDLRESYDEIWDAARKILDGLSKIR